MKLCIATLTYRGGRERKEGGRERGGERKGEGEKVIPLNFIIGVVAFTVITTHAAITTTTTITNITTITTTTITDCSSTMVTYLTQQ